jgi:nitrate reductase NapE component
LFIGPIIQLKTLSDYAPEDEEGKTSKCNEKKNEEIKNFLNITFGAYSSCIISIFLLAAFLLKVWGIMFGKYKLISIGVVPAINNLSRTFMLLIANIVGFLPYWLGKVEFGRI